MNLIIHDQLDGPVTRRELNSRVRANLLDKEKEFGRCNKIWSFTNPKGERYLFGKFGDLIITLAYFEPLISKWWPT